MHPRCQRLKTTMSRNSRGELFFAVPQRLRLDVVQALFAEDGHCHEQEVLLTTDNEHEHRCICCSKLPGFCPRPQMVHVVGVIACCLGVVLGHSFHESRRSHLLVSTLMYTISLQCYRYHLKPALQARCKMRAAKCKEAKTLEV